MEYESVSGNTLPVPPDSETVVEDAEVEAGIPSTDAILDEILNVLKDGAGGTESPADAGETTGGTAETGDDVTQQGNEETLVQPPVDVTPYLQQIEASLNDILLLQREYYAETLAREEVRVNHLENILATCIVGLSVAGLIFGAFLSKLIMRYIRHE